MGLESNPQYIPQLDDAWPLGTDSQDQGDDHLRNIKRVLKTQFPNIGNAAVLATAQELNQLDNYQIAKGGVEQRLDLLEGLSVNRGFGGWYGTALTQFSLANNVQLLYDPNTQNLISGSQNVSAVGDGSVTVSNTPKDLIRLDFQCRIRETNLGSVPLVITFSDGSATGNVSMRYTLLQNEWQVMTLSAIFPAEIVAGQKYWVQFAQNSGVTVNFETEHAWLRVEYV